MPRDPSQASPGAELGNIKGNVQAAFIECFKDDLLQARQLLMSQVNNLFKMRNAGEPLQYKLTGYDKLHDFLMDIPGLGLQGVGNRMEVCICDANRFKGFCDKVARGRDVPSFRKPNPVPESFQWSVIEVFRRTGSREIPARNFRDIWNMIFPDQKLQCKEFGYRDVKGLLANVPVVEKVGGKYNTKYVLNGDISLDGGPQQLGTDALPLDGQPARHPHTGLLNVRASHSRNSTGNLSCTTESSMDSMLQAQSMPGQAALAALSGQRQSGHSVVWDLQPPSPCGVNAAAEAGSAQNVWAASPQQQRQQQQPLPQTHNAAGSFSQVGSPVLPTHNAVGCFSPVGSSGGDASAGTAGIPRKALGSWATGAVPWTANGPLPESSRQPGASVSFNRSLAPAPLGAATRVHNTGPKVDPDGAGSAASQVQPSKEDPLRSAEDMAMPSGIPLNVKGLSRAKDFDTGPPECHGLPPGLAVSEAPSSAAAVSGMGSPLPAVDEATETTTDELGNALPRKRVKQRKQMKNEGFFVTAPGALSSGDRDVLKHQGKFDMASVYQAQLRTDRYCMIVDFSSGRVLFSNSLCDSLFENMTPLPQRDVAELIFEDDRLGFSACVMYLSIGKFTTMEPQQMRIVTAKGVQLANVTGEQLVGSWWRLDFAAKEAIDTVTMATANTHGLVRAGSPLPEASAGAPSASGNVPPMPMDEPFFL